MQGAVRTMVVEVRHIFVQHRRKMAAVNDQHPVQQFAADSPDPSFGDCICSGCPYRGAQDAHALASEHGIEHARELAVAVSDQEPELGCAVAEVHQQVTCLLGHPGAAGVGSDSEEMDATGGVLQTNSTYNRWSSRVSTQKKSVARMPCVWAVRNCRQLGPSRRGACRAASRLDPSSGHQVSMPPGSPRSST